MNRMSSVAESPAGPDFGAIVTCFGSSAGMLELARRRLGPDTDLHVADLGSPLPFPDGAYDDVVACLVLHTCRTGRRRWPSCGACSSPADG
jgi:SAM-dependent methyltransferase